MEAVNGQSVRVKVCASDEKGVGKMRVWLMKNGGILGFI